VLGKLALSVLALVALLLSGPLFVAFSQGVSLEADWSSASRRAAGLMPDAKSIPQAVVQVYGARAFEWRAAFAIHTWIAVKPAGADSFVIYQLVEYNRYDGKDILETDRGVPDRYWFGAKPCIIAELRGSAAADAIKRISDAVAQYPDKEEYRAWPGPNSNTFTAYILRRVPALKADLPPTAIGKDYLPNGRFVSTAPSGHGTQVSLFGLLGVLVSPVEGVEFNLLGLSFGIDLHPWALRYPGIGRVGGAVQPPGHCS
jgi:hypothetical protein